MVGTCNAPNRGLLIWPWIDVGTEKIDPLRDARVSEIYGQLKMNMGDFSAPWSVGQDGAGRCKLQSISGVCTNTKELFIVGENRIYGFCSFGVFDSNGMFLNRVSCPELVRPVHDLATNQQDNLYLLVTPEPDDKLVGDVSRIWVYVYDKDNDLNHRFPVQIMGFGASVLAVENSSNKTMILVLGSYRTYYGAEIACRRSPLPYISV